MAHAPVHDISLDPNYDPAYGRVLHRGPASIWPFVTAAAIALAGSVLVLNWFIFIPAAFLFVWAFRAWMTELLHEEPHEH